MCTLANFVLLTCYVSLFKALNFPSGPLRFKIDLPCPNVATHLFITFKFTNQVFRTNKKKYLDI